MTPRARPELSVGSRPCPALLQWTSTHSHSSCSARPTHPGMTGSRKHAPRQDSRRLVFILGRFSSGHVATRNGIRRKAYSRRMVGCTTIPHSSDLGGGCYEPRSSLFNVTETRAVCLSACLGTGRGRPGQASIKTTSERAGEIRTSMRLAGSRSRRQSASVGSRGAHHLWASRCGWTQWKQSAIPRGRPG